MRCCATAQKSRGRTELLGRDKLPRRLLLEQQRFSRGLDRDDFFRGTRFDLALHERREHPPRADRVARDAGARGLERGDLREAEQAVLGRDVRGLARRGDKAMRRGDVDDPAPVVRAHARQHEARGVKRGGEVERDHRVPLLDGKFFDGCDVLDTRVVDEDIDATELARRVRHHRRDVVELREIRAVITDAHAGRGERLARGLGVPEAVEDDRGALGGQCSRDAEADAARRTGDECNLHA